MVFHNRLLSVNNQLHYYDSCTQSIEQQNKTRHLTLICLYYLDNVVN
jgi:hypothetical protein